jgi:iron complex transport system ATP-binding protein
LTELALHEVQVARGGRLVLCGVSARVRPGELVALIGPNGAGKTTLLRAALGLLPLAAGSVQINGVDPRRMAPGARARAAAYLPQARPLAWPLSVQAVVALGRFAYGAPLQRPRGEDADAIAHALAACRLGPLAQRPTDQLSGGELARVHVARALASAAPLLLADEPTAALDPRHAFETMAIVKAFCASGGGALVTLHDLPLAARFADRVLVLQQGRLVADGPPAEALSPPLLAQTFGVQARLLGDALVIDGPLPAG